MKKHKHGKDLVFLAVILILVLVMLYSGLQILESTVLRTGTETAGNAVSKTITRDGVDYFPRQDITVVLVMGIDQYGQVADSETYSNQGASDMNMLLIFDEANETCSVLHLNRDTMVEMPVLGIGGRKAGTYYGQLALSHTYGTGLADSCENTRETISGLLYGIRIDYYVAMNMDAIAILNDAVGGVTVNVTDDFSQVDPTIGKGQVTLMGQQAINFVRTRKDVGDQLNLSRIERHKEYIDSFVEAFRARQEQETEFIMTAYEEVAPYLVTDCSANAISGMVERYGEYQVAEVVSPDGENVMGEEYFEFYLDEEKLDALILRLFYAPKH
ncbi:MAG: LCP family protein [Oscillospiraceae bacterium]|nr:LCP family protein [Oscillospiraceae bacterium]